MDKIFIAFIFMFINIHLDFGAMRIGLVPDFVGGIFLLLAMRELKEESGYFAKNDVPVLIYVIATAVFWLMDLVGAFFNLGFVNWLLDAAMKALMLYMTYNVVKGIGDMQTNHSVNMEADILFTYWIILAVLQGINLIGTLSHNLLAIEIVSIIATIVVIVLFLMKLYTAKKNYEECCSHKTEA